MLKNSFLLLMLAMFAAGCTGMQAQSYIKTTERVDIQANEQGNAGYIFGQGQYKEPQKKTRKVYVLELTKPTPEDLAEEAKAEIKKAPQENVAQVPIAAEETHEADIPMQHKLVIPRIDDVEESSVPQSKMSFQAPSVEGQTYKVEKDDTLQKISKKFYNSYGKWIKIYEANKEKLKNPNFLKPGTVLVIPPMESEKTTGQGQ